MEYAFIYLEEEDIRHNDLEGLNSSNFCLCLIKAYPEVY